MSGYKEYERHEDGIYRERFPSSSSSSSSSNESDDSNRSTGSNECGVSESYEEEQEEQEEEMNEEDMLIENTPSLYKNEDFKRQKEKKMQIESPRSDSEDIEESSIEENTRSLGGKGSKPSHIVRDHLKEKLLSNTKFQDGAVDDIAELVNKLISSDINDNKPNVLSLILCGSKCTGIQESIITITGHFPKAYCIKHNSMTGSTKTLIEQLSLTKACCERSRQSSSTVEPLVIVSIEDIHLSTPVILNDIHKIFNGDKSNEFKIPSWMKVILIYTGVFGLLEMYQTPVEEREYEYPNFKEVIRKDLDKLFSVNYMSVLHRYIIPFIPLPDDVVEKKLHDKLKNYIKRNRFSSKYGEPDTSFSNEIVQIGMNQYRTDGNIENAYKIIEEYMHKFLEGGYDHFKQHLPDQKTKLTPSPSIIYESIVYDDTLKDKVNDPSFEIAIRDRTNKCHYDKVLKKKTSLEMVRLEHALLPNPYISIINPNITVNQHISIRNDPQLEQKYEESQQKLYRVMEVVESNIGDNDLKSKMDRIQTIITGKTIDISKKRKEIEAPYDQPSSKKVKLIENVSNDNNNDSDDEKITCISCNIAKNRSCFLKQLKGTRRHDLSKTIKKCVSCYRKEGSQNVKVQTNI